MMDRISIAAKMAGEWWAQRLSRRHEDKRSTFSEAVAIRVEESMRGTAYFGYDGERKEGKGVPRECVPTDVDYDPQGLILDAVREVIDPNCRGIAFSADGILPRKHSLMVSAKKLTPKEGYGNWTSPIEVPEP